MLLSYSVLRKEGSIKRIYYDEAAKIIGVTVDSLKQAVSRGELTRAGYKGHYQTVVKEQVELFKGRRISYKSLSESDKVLWHKYAQGAITGRKKEYNVSFKQDFLGLELSSPKECVRELCEISNRLNAEEDDPNYRYYIHSWRIIRHYEDSVFTRFYLIVELRKENDG